MTDTTKTQLPKVGTAVAIRTDSKNTVRRNTKMPVGRGEIDGVPFVVTYGGDGVGSVSVRFDDNTSCSYSYIIDLEDFVHNAYHAHKQLLEAGEVQREYDAAWKPFCNALFTREDKSGSLAI